MLIRNFTVKQLDIFLNLKFLFFQQFKDQNLKFIINQEFDLNFYF